MVEEKKAKETVAREYSRRARLYIEQDNPQMAIECFSEAIEADPGSATLCYALRGSQYEKIDSYKKALADYEKYLELDDRQRDSLRWKMDIKAGVSPIRKDVCGKITGLRIKLMNRKKT